jgi:hypothetical protein
MRPCDPGPLPAELTLLPNIIAAVGEGDVLDAANIPFIFSDTTEIGFFFPFPFD